MLHDKRQEQIQKRLKGRGDLDTSEPIQGTSAKRAHFGRSLYNRPPFTGELMRLFTLVAAGMCLVGSCGSTLEGSTGNLAALFSLDEPALEAAFQNETGPARQLAGLVLADVYGTTSPDKALRQLESLGAVDGSADTLAYANAIRCAALVRRSELTRAQQHCEQADALTDTLQVPLVRVRVLAAVHFLAIRRGMLERGLEIALRVERLAAELGDPYLEATALNASALTFSFSGLHSRAIDRYEQARRKLASYDDRPLAKMITFNLGLAYLETGDPANALAAFREGYEWARSTDQAHRVFIGQIEMANALNQLGRPRETVDLLGPTLEDNPDTRDPDSLMHALLAIGRAELLLNNPDRALTHLARGLSLAREFGNERRLRQLELARINALRANGETAQALAAADNLVVQLRAALPNDELDQALDQLAALEASAGKPSSAYEHHLEAQKLADEARGATFQRRLTLLEVANRVERSQREAELAQLNELAATARAERDRILAIAGAVCFLMALALVAFDLKRRRQRLEVSEHRNNAEALEQLVEERTRALEEQLTERMKAEEERRKLERELAETDKLRSLGLLTGGVAHDFNNLLTVISGAAELLELDPDMAAQKRTELIQSIQEAATSGGEITLGLLAYARRQQLNPELTDLTEFFDSSKALLQRTLGAEMALEIMPAALTVLVDKSQLTTAIINLLTNAREASDSRGNVLITVIRSQNESRCDALIKVRDWGRGMTKEEAARSIEPFYSTKQAVAASGLGLSRVFGFVEQSGGHMEIDSEPGVGTTVTLAFPIADETSDEVRTLPGTWTPPRKVLLVDDNDEVREMVERMLRSLGHSVTTADNGETALALVREAAPDVLVTDVLMPGTLGGKELAAAVREQAPDLPILMISGFAEAPDLEYPLLAKPFRLTELDAALRRLTRSTVVPMPRRGR